MTICKHCGQPKDKHEWTPHWDKCTPDKYEPLFNDREIMFLNDVLRSIGPGEVAHSIADKLGLELT